MSSSQKRIKPQDLKIVWSNDSRYWRMPPSGSNQTEQPAELLQVCWLEVTGSCEVDKSKKCQVSFEVSLTPDAFGWNNTTLYIMAKRGEKGKYSWKKVTLSNRSNKDGSFLIPGSDLIIDPLDRDATDDKLYFGLYEIWKGNWKGGLKIHQAIVKEID